jgi:hypothetical protein
MFEIDGQKLTDEEKAMAQKAIIALALASAKSAASGEGLIFARTPIATGGHAFVVAVCEKDEAACCRAIIRVAAESVPELADLLADDSEEG